MPVVPNCALDEQGMSRQLDRYRRIGLGARVLERSDRRLAVELHDGADRDLVAETVAVERECCSFVDVSWNRVARRLVFSVSRTEDEPALEAIVFSLALPAV
jgi:hypothetical protein